MGLSPLARGNPTAIASIGKSSGPIPARAGEPTATISADDLTRAYPRSRGGTTRLSNDPRPFPGLSPLARGNRRPAKRGRACRGPIPARAGEPSPTAAACRSGRAYPRSRGGTLQMSGCCQAARGLSPLARGNPTRGMSVRAVVGPIPARAGEPVDGSLSLFRIWAYPRSRGGTWLRDDDMADPTGLSPLARGNLFRIMIYTVCKGPIPARAGEPDIHLISCNDVGAYPRSRGGTAISPPFFVNTSGLSPLARGNHRVTRVEDLRLGPIPARAGEPAQRVIAAPAGRAYPRSRGGTLNGRPSTLPCDGLSPLARGNRRADDRDHFRFGPIPARAGEPAFQ